MPDTEKKPDIIGERELKKAHELAIHLAATGWHRYRTHGTWPVSHSTTLCAIIEGQFLTRVIVHGEPRHSSIVYEMWWKLETKKQGDEQTRVTQGATT